jgi:hypothetical protein
MNGMERLSVFSLLLLAEFFIVWGIKKLIRVQVRAKQLN